MSSIINGISQNSDMQAMIMSMFNKINNATINAGKDVKTSGVEGISSSEFVKELEKQLKMSEDLLSGKNNLTNKAEQVGMPSNLSVSEDNSITKDIYGELVSSIINNLDKNSDGKISEKEIKNFTEKLSKSDDVETTGSLASSKAGDFLKNQASNFIQKLIDKYKDNSESVLGIFV